MFIADGLGVWCVDIASIILNGIRLSLSLGRFGVREDNYIVNNLSMFNSKEDGIEFAPSG